MSLDEFYQHLSDEEKVIYTEIAECANQLGYKPRKAKTQYTHLLYEGVRAVVEEYNYKYTGCYRNYNN